MARTTPNQTISDMSAPTPRPANVLTYEEAQAETGISHKWLRRLAAAGVLKIIRLGHRTVYIRRAELDRVVKLFEDKPTIAAAQLRHD
jgi:excisionase family DNA binding protein